MQETFESGSPWAKVSNPVWWVCPSVKGFSAPSTVKTGEMPPFSRIFRAVAELAEAGESSETEKIFDELFSLVEGKSEGFL